MHRPAPGGKVRSAHADTETISGTSTLIALLSVFVVSNLPERDGDICFCSPLLTWRSGKSGRIKRNKERIKDQAEEVKYVCVIR